MKFILKYLNIIVKYIYKKNKIYFLIDKINLFFAIKNYNQV